MIYYGREEKNVNIWFCLRLTLLSFILKVVCSFEIWFCLLVGFFLIEKEG